MNLSIKNIKRRFKQWKTGLIARFQRERRPSSAFVRLFNAYHAGNNPPKVLLFGDSVAERVSWNDYDDRTLAEMITLNLKGHAEAAVVSYGGFTLDVFYHLTLALGKMKHKPGLAVLPINMRNFSPQWDLEPTWQFAPEIEQMQRFIADPSLLPSMEQARRETIPPEVFNAFDATPVECALSPFDRIAQFRLLVNATPATEEQRKFRLRQIFVFHYAFRLARGHRKLESLEGILSLLQGMGIPFLAYATPINIDAGIRLAGAEWAAALRENVSVVSRLVGGHLTDERSAFRDWSESMRSEYFFHADNATEHLNEDGRKILARSIADEVFAMMARDGASPSSLTSKGVME